MSGVTAEADGAAERAASALRPRGSNQGGVRQYNERVLLQAIRQRGAMPAADLARLTHLTAQTVSQITKKLEAEGLLARGAPQRGKVGQPSVPLALNPDGAYAVGIKVGRRSLDVLLVDFTGRPRERWRLAHAFPDPPLLLAEIGARLKEIRRKLGPAGRERVQGIGIAAPLALGGWQALLGMPAALAARWNVTDLAAEVTRLSPWPVQQVKDTAAACVAELVAGRGRGVPSYLYIYVDTFIGGALVIDGQLRAGPHGNAGAVGSLPLAQAGPDERAPAQLLAAASLLNLEHAYAQAGLDVRAALDERALEPPWDVHTRRWLGAAAAAIALAVIDGACLLELDGVIVDGAFARPLQAALLEACAQALARYSWEGVRRPALLAGSVGADAGALGGALLPLQAAFAPDRELFLKVAVA